MLNKNITKILAFVTIICGFCLILTNCSNSGLSNLVNSVTKKKTDFDASDNYTDPKVMGNIKSDEIAEGSGLVASRCNQDVFWTHNDSGDKALIFAINLKGDKLATYAVKGAKSVDWEDIATMKTSSGECFLYIGDFGNNSMARGDLTIYRVKEPKVSQSTNSSKASPLETDTAEAIQYQYPDSRRNAETLMVHPVTGDIYIFSKQPNTPSIIYKLSMKDGKPPVSGGMNSVEKIGEYAVPAVPNGQMTGGDISPDGRHAVICDYLAGYEIELPKDDKNFDDIWKQKPTKINLGDRQQGEAICYGLDGNTIYATSEKKNSPIIEVKRK